MANTQAAGWLPYGSSDDSVLLQVGMTSEAEMTAIATTPGATSSAELNATPEFDSVKGMKASGTSLGWLITELTDYATLDAGGQVSFEIEKEFLCYIDATTGSTGDDTAATNTNNPTPLCVRVGASGAGNYRTLFGHVKSSGLKRAFVNMDTNGAATTARAHYYDGIIHAPAGTPGAYTHSIGKPDFIRVNIGWAGNKVWYAIDNLLLEVDDAATSTDTSKFQRVYIGSLIASAGYKIGNWFMRNLQISNKIPVFPSHPQLRRAVMWSDSLFSQAHCGVTTDSYADSMACGVVRKELAKSGLYFGDLTVDVDSGQSLSMGAKFSATVANVTAVRPNFVIFQGGTNDIINASWSSSTFETDYKANLTTLLNAGVEKIICCTVPSAKYDTRYLRGGATKQAHGEANAVIKALPSWNSAVTVADVDSEFGGWDCPPEMLKGGYDGTSLDLHWHALGHINAGKAIAKAIRKSLG